MPLLDHFHPPVFPRHQWEGFHNGWAANIAFGLNSGLLPPEYYAAPWQQIGGRIEVDVATLGPAAGEPTPTGSWNPPPPAASVPLVPADEAAEVRISRDSGGPDLRAAIELVSPSNKDRPTARQAFAAKCAAYLRRGVSVIIVDAVTSRSADLHADILAALDPTGSADGAPGRLYAVAYRGAVGVDPPRVEVWPHALSVGEALPELPLWLEPDLCIPLRLEESYAATCTALRIRG